MFTYLRDSDADIEVIEGDARIALTAEFEESRPRQKFDILILDAFSSDSVPIHLLTREAFALYADHLAANGTIALHISSRYLKLTQLAFRLGGSVGFDAIEVLNKASPQNRSIRSKWVIFSRDPQNLVLLGDYIDSQRDVLGLNESSVRIRKPRANIVAKAPLWTDQYSNLFGIVK
jgi:spermidine synthase